MNAPRRFTMSTVPTSDTAPSAEPPLQFILDGVRLPVAASEPVDGEDSTLAKSEPAPESWEEVFTVLDSIPPGALADLSNGASVNEKGDVVWNRLAVMRFVRACLVPEDEARWDYLVRDKRRPVQLDKLGEVMFYITAEKADRPTGPQPGSSNGLRETGDGSEPDLSTEGTPPTS